MKKEILEYIATQRVGVLAVEMPDGSPHAATVHFSHTEDPLVFCFETYNDSRKYQSIAAGASARASLVIGSDESTMKTLQMDGALMELKDHVSVPAKAYLKKFYEKKVKTADPRFRYLVFTPSWWRFTDWTRPEGKLILTSA